MSFDTTRYDHVGCAGDPEAHTPVVDALAARGVLFERAYASVALTLPEHTTIMTGLEPLGHGVHNNGRFRVPDALETLAERLRADGYQTAAFVSAYVLNARYNLDQGFDTYDDDTHTPANRLQLTVPQRSGAEVTDAAVRWLGQRTEERPGERPFFLWVHYYDPHLPRTATPPFDTMPDRYAAEIAYADAQLGRLLEAVAADGGARPAVVIFTADHGEGLGEHGEKTHGILAYDSTLHVPLIVVGPGVPAGTRSDALARHVDLVPTILALAGQEVPAGLPGRNLLAAGSPAAARVPASSIDADADGPVGYFESQGPHLDLGWAALEGVRTPRWKYTATPEPRELYDLRADPREEHNLIDAEPAVRAEMERRFAGVQARHASAIPAREQRLRAEEMEKLAALGYVQAPRAHTAGREPDPRRFAVIRDTVDDARWLADAGRYAPAIEVLETLAYSPSVRALVLRTLAPIYAEAGRTDDAIGAYREYIALTGAEEAYLGLGRTLLRTDRAREALDVLERVTPPSATTRMLRAHALMRLGRRDEARAAVDEAYAGRRSDVVRLRKRAALVIDAAPIPDGDAELRGLLAAAPDDPLLQSRLGYYLAVWGAPEQGAEAYRLLAAAAGAEPADAEIQANLGWGAARLGRDAEAVSALEAALALERRSAIDRFRLAIVLGRTGQRDRAAALVDSALELEPAAPWAAKARALRARLGSAHAGPPMPETVP